MKRMYRWQFHFNAMHNMQPFRIETKHAHSFLVVLCLEIIDMDMKRQNDCERDVKEFLSQFNGKYLNDLEMFNGKLPSIENICETLYFNLKDIVKKNGMELLQLEVGDSPISLYSFAENPLFSSSYISLFDMNYEA